MSELNPIVDLQELSFDEYDPECMSAVGGTHLAGPLMSLLSCANQINMAERIGALNEKKALEWMRRAAEEIRQACKAEWREQL